MAPNDKQTTRICSEIAIREWPQKWPELTQLITHNDHPVAPLHLIRIFAEIQFHINNQNIPNITRQKDLSKEIVKNILIFFEIFNRFENLSSLSLRSSL